MADKNDGVCKEIGISFMDCRNSLWDTGILRFLDVISISRTLY